MQRGLKADGQSRLNAVPVLRRRSPLLKFYGPVIYRNDDRLSIDSRGFNSLRDRHIDPIF